MRKQVTLDQRWSVRIKYIFRGGERGGSLAFDENQEKELRWIEDRQVAFREASRIVADINERGLIGLFHHTYDISDQTKERIFSIMIEVTKESWISSGGKRTYLGEVIDDFTFWYVENGIVGTQARAFGEEDER